MINPDAKLGKVFGIHYEDRHVQDDQQDRETHQRT